MNNFLRSMMESASDAGKFTASLAESGVKSVHEVFSGTALFGALSAGSEEDVDYDETHYVLVPVLGGAKDYAIYTKRFLPSGVGPKNSLPKARVFHVPAAEGKELLEQELVASMVSDQVSDSVGSSDLADTLERLADKIDRETSKISGGLLLIGGAVAAVNPLLGVGIAAKALLPSVGTIASKAGVEYLGNKLRKRNKSSEVSKMRKDASAEVKKFKPVIYVNPIIRSLEAVATNPETDFDPVMDMSNWVDKFESPYYYSLTQEAVREVYKDAFDSLDLGAYQTSHIQWLRLMMDS